MIEKEITVLEIDFLRLLKACEYSGNSVDGNLKLQGKLRLLKDMLKAMEMKKKVSMTSGLISSDMLYQYKQKLRILEKEKAISVILQEEIDQTEREPNDSEKLDRRERMQNVDIKELPKDSCDITSNSMQTEREILFRGSKSSNNEEKQMNQLFDKERESQEYLKEDLFDIIGKLRNRVSGIQDELAMDKARLEAINSKTEKNLGSIQSIRNDLNIAISQTSSTCKSFVFIVLVSIGVILLTKILPKY